MRNVLILRTLHLHPHDTDIFLTLSDLPGMFSIYLSTDVVACPHPKETEYTRDDSDPPPPKKKKTQKVISYQPPFGAL